MPRDDTGVDRRRFLAALAAGSLAGCTETTETTPTERRTNERTTGTATRDGGTATPADTETPTPEGTPRPRPLEGSWTGYAYDLGNSGFNPDTRPLTGHRLAWSVKVRGDNTLPEPIVTPAFVHVNTETWVYGIDREAAVTEWRTDLGLPTYFFTPALEDGVLYTPARAMSGVFRGTDTPGRLVALDAATGERRWEREAFVNSSPLLHDGLLYHAASTLDAGRVEALAVDGDGAEPRWTYEFGSGEFARALGTPAYDGGTVFATGTVGSDDPAGRLVALDAATGERRWRVTADAATPNGPACSDGDVFFPADDGSLFSVDVETGSTNWVRTFDERVTGKPSVGNGFVYVLSDDTLHAVDRDTGDHQWSQPVDPLEENFTVTDEAAYVGGTTLDGIDAQTGELLWERTIDGYTGGFGVPAVVDGYLYTGVCVKETDKSVYENFVYSLG